MKNSVALVAGVALLAAGYSVGAYVGYPFVDKALLEGNISKAKVYNEAENPELLAAMEQLANDTAYQQEVVMTTALLNARVLQMDQLINATVKATEGIEELTELHEIMAAHSKSTANATVAYETYLTEIDKVMNGEKSEEYEQASNNAAMAYLKLENYVSDAPAYINSLMNYLETTENEELGDLVAQWAEYCAEDAVLNDSKSDIAYWETAYNTLNGRQLRLRGRKAAEVFAAIPTMEAVLGSAGRAYRNIVNNNSRLSLRMRELSDKAPQLYASGRVYRNVVNTRALLNTGRYYRHEVGNNATSELLQGRR